MIWQMPLTVIAGWLADNTEGGSTMFKDTFTPDNLEKSDCLVLKWTEMMWRICGYDPVFPGNGKYLGEAGNPSYRNCLTALRIGSEVLVCFEGKNHVIPAKTVVKGFGEDKDGRELNYLMTEDVVYSYTLEPIT
jgi:hypothetical protein